MEKGKEESKNSGAEPQERLINLTSAYIQNRSYEKVLDKKYYKKLQVATEDLLFLGDCRRTIKLKHRLNSRGKIR